MTDLRKAAEQALEALEANLGKWAAKTKAVEALRQALAQDALKTVADIDHSIGLFIDSPKQWVGLTEVDICEVMDFDFDDEFEFAKAIEAKLKEKNNGSSNT